MVTGYAQAAILSASIALQLSAAVLALLMIRRSGFYLPWMLVAAAVVLMSVRRVISFVQLISGDLSLPVAVSPEIVALVISVLMVGGLALLGPAVEAIRRREELARVAADEQALLARESHHHVKNDLQLLHSLVSLQEGLERDATRARFLTELGARIRTIGLLHQQLYEAESHDSFVGYVTELVTQIKASYADAIPGLELRLDVDELPFDRRAFLHCGLILTEALSNALKYAFGETASPVVHVTAAVRDGVPMLEVRDNGCGLPAEGEPKLGFGSILMRGICEREGWPLTVVSDGGVLVRVELGHSASATGSGRYSHTQSASHLRRA